MLLAISRKKRWGCAVCQPVYGRRSTIYGYLRRRKWVSRCWIWLLYNNCHWRRCAGMEQKSRKYCFWKRFAKVSTTRWSTPKTCRLDFAVGSESRFCLFDTASDTAGEQQNINLLTLYLHAEITLYVSFVRTGWLYSFDSRCLVCMLHLTGLLFPVPSLPLVNGGPGVTLETLLKW